MTSKEERRQKLLAKFRVIARERVAKIDGAFGALESGSQDSSLTDEMMREIHTLKGEARLMGFEEVSRVTHFTEDLLAWSRDRSFQVTSEASELVFAGLDLVRSLLVEEPAAATLGPRVAELEAKVGALVEGKGSASEASPTGGEAIEEEGGRSAASQATPPAKSVKHDPGPRLAPAAPTGSAAGAGRDSNDFVRVPSEALSSLTRMMFELSLHQESMTRLLGELQRMRSTEEGAASWVKDSFDLLRDMGDADFEVRLRIDDLQERLRQLGLLQVQALFERYPSAIRELAQQQGKKVRVLIEGASVAVDKQVLDRIDDPLLHLVRNSVDHGLERPEERLAAGKPAQGTLVLGARQLGSQVEIWVEDDGRGLFPDRIREIAAARGLVTPGQTQSDEAAIQLLFEPGFSTREQVTDISGRGVGLDVVKARAESLGGSVKVFSRPGRGTTFSMRLPISAALCRALLFRAGATIFALPASHVAAVARPPRQEIEAVGPGRALRIDGIAVPILNLAQSVVGEERALADADPVVVVMEHDGQRLALIVDAVLGERQTVLQPAGAFLEGVSTSSGTVLLEGGAVAVVLNAPEVMRLWGDGKRPLSSPAQQADGERGRRRRILIVDDSELTRDMLVGVAGRLELETMEAVDGREALERIRESTPDLVLTDIDMPVLDGFALIESLRSAPLTRDLPIVVLSTRGSDEDKRRAMAAGADGYLVKLDFDEATFKQLLWRFLDQ